MWLFCRDVIWKVKRRSKTWQVFETAMHILDYPEVNVCLLAPVCIL